MDSQNLLCYGPKMYNTTGGRRIAENQTSRSIGNILRNDKKFSRKEKYLKGKEWAIGLEHEVQFFYGHNIFYKKKDDSQIIKFIVQANTEAVIFDIINDLNETEKEFLLNNVDLESSGRICHGKSILKNTPSKKESILMPEFITTDPFCSIDKGKRGFVNFYKKLIEDEKYFVNILNQSELLKSQEQKQGSLIQFPFGMCSYIKIAEKDSYYKTNLKLKKKLFEDYLGSYHVTFTLPYNKKEKYTQKDQNDFIEMHRNFGAQFQWIEPLLTAAFFSCDEKCVGSLEKRIRGSWRVARVGWGNFAGTDVDKLKTGVGRYADIKPHWRENFDFFESNKVNQCLPNNPYLRYNPDYPKGIKEFPANAVSSFSSNLRTFGPNPYYDKNKDKKEYSKISGFKMEIPNGLEIRIFDHFETIFLIDLLNIIALLAGNIENTKVKSTVYQNPHWIKAVQDTMLYGWKAELSEDYVRCLEEELKLTLTPKTLMAYDVLVEVVNKLWEKNKDTDNVYLVAEKLKKQKPVIPQINKRSWEMAFLLKLSNSEKDYQNFIKFLETIKSKTNTEDFKTLLLKIMGKNWKNDWDNVLYFLIDRKIMKKKGDKLTLITEGFIIIPYLRTLEIYFELNGFKSYLKLKKEKNELNTLKSFDKNLTKYLNFTGKRLDKIYDNYIFKK